MTVLQRRSPLRSALRTLLEWVLIVLITLALGEAVARLAGVRPLTAADRLWRHHPRWGWHHEPNSDDVFVKADFEQPIHINSHGLREREIGYEKPAGELRILVIGDSSVAGFEVKEEERFTRVLEARLRQHGWPVQVVNAGVRGWGTDQSLLYLEDEGVRYAPDVVLYRWNTNDPADNATVHRPFRVYGKPWFAARPDGSIEPRGIPVPHYPYRENLRVGDDGEPEEMPVTFRNAAVLWLRDVFVCRSAFASWMVNVAIHTDAFSRSLKSASSYNDAGDVPTSKIDPTSQVYRATTGMLRAMNEAARGAGARFALIAALPDVEPMRVEAGIAELDDMDRFKARLYPGAPVYVPNDGHPNALGHRLYGEALAEAVEASGILGTPPATVTHNAP